MCAKATAVEETLVVISDCGTLVQPNVHDGYVRGIAISNKNEIVALLDSLEGPSYELIMHDIVAFKADDFREGNIILDITITTRRLISVAELSHLIDVDNYENRKNYIDSIIAKINEGALYFIELNPSYGCFFSCLCKSYELKFRSEEITGT